MNAPNLDVALSISTQGRAVVAKVVITNKDQKPVDLFRPLLGPDDALSMNLFEIRNAKGERLGYKGILAKRIPGPHDFLPLAPGVPRVVEFRLDQHYNFPPEGGDFAAVYSAYNQSLDEDAPLCKLRSNEVAFKLQAK